MNIIQNTLTLEQKKMILQGGYDEPIVVHDFLEPSFAESLYEYIVHQQYERSENEITKKYLLQDRISVLHQGDNPLKKWYEFVQSPDFLLLKLLQAHTKRKVFFIEGKSFNVHKYKYDDYHKKHKDSASKIGLEELESKGWGKSLVFHICLTKNWKKGYGGELVFYKDNGEKVVQAPIFNTLWVYPAQDLYHEVLPITKSDFERYILLNVYYAYIR